MVKTGHINKDKKIVVKNKDNVKFLNRKKGRFKVRFNSKKKNTKTSSKIIPKIRPKKEKANVKTGNISDKMVIDTTDKKVKTGKLGDAYTISLESSKKKKQKTKIKFKKSEKSNDLKIEEKEQPSFSEEDLWPKEEVKKEPPKLQLRFKPGKKQKEEPKEGIKEGRFSAIPRGFAQIEKKEEKKKKTEYKKIKIPEIENIENEVLEKDESELKFTDIKYPLVPSNPEKGEKVFAYAHIFWDTSEEGLFYKIVEPKLTEQDKKNLKKLKDYIQEKIDVNFNSVKRSEAFEYLKKIFQEGLEYFEMQANEKTDIYKYYVKRDFIGLGTVDPLLKDENIEDISCDGINIPIYVYHRNPAFGSVKTNLMFESGDDLDLFVTKLAERCGKSISQANPLANGTLPDGSRVQATLSSDIARQGSNFTIRKFTEKPLTPAHLLENKTIDVKTLSYLWQAVEHGSSVLLSGGTATGKTTLLNVLSLFIKPQMKIVSIEDTAELRLPHSHWIPEVARMPIETKEEVDMFTLLKESLRQRPDYIIVGEVRGREAFVLFQQIAIGHPGLSTIHAENFTQLMNRLTTKPISLPPNLIGSLDLIIFLKSMRKEDKYFRRVNSVMEVMDFDREENETETNELFEHKAKEDQIKTMNESVLLNDFAEDSGKDEFEIQEEIKEKGMVIRWMVEKNIKDYKQVGKVVNMYYSNKDKLISKIEGEL